MSNVLYTLGRWCARHAWRTLALWLVALAALGGGALTLGTPPTSQVSIPGSDFQKVFDTLGAKIPELSGGFGTVVLTSETGAFTPAQKDAAAAVFAQWDQVAHVNRVVNPFESQARLDGAATEISTGGQKIAEGEKRLAEAKKQLDAATAQVGQGLGFIQMIEQGNPADPGLPALKAKVAEGQKQLAEGQKKYDEGVAQLDAAKVALEQGRTQNAAVNGIRFVSADGRHAIAQVQFDTNTNSVPYDDRARIMALGETLASHGMTADYSMEITQKVSLAGVGEAIGLAVAALVLIVMLGTLVAAGLPLLVALLGVGVGLAGAVTLTHFYEMNSLTPALALMLGLAVGIDYSLFIVNRHRGEYLFGRDLEPSIGRAVGTAGSAVVFAGLTVIIALAALVLSGIPLLAQMGLVAAATVAVAVMVAVTVTPAVLRLIGPRVASKRLWTAHGYGVPGDPDTRVAPQGEHEEEHGAWYVRLVTRHPWLTVLAVLAIVGVLAAPVADLRLGLPDGSSEPADSTAHRTYQLVDSQFTPGMNGPLVAVATLPSGSDEADAATATAKLTHQFSLVEGVKHVVAFGQSADHQTLAFQIVPTTGPADAETVQTVKALRGSAGPIGSAVGASIGFTGQTVANIEISERLAAALPGYLGVVVGLSLLILLMVFRSLMVPVIATLGFLLSVAAAFGVAVAVYQWGWGGSVLGVSQPGPILSFMPIILIGVLFGLAMDYQMFLVSGMREAWAHGEAPRAAVRSGFVHGAKVVTAAALIMFSVFGGFVWSHLTMVRPIGLGLAVGVLVDAVLVRMTLTPALMHILDSSAWALPRWLSWVPNVDVEGAALTERLATEEATGATAKAAAGAPGAVASESGDPRHVSQVS